MDPCETMNMTTSKVSWRNMHSVTLYTLREHEHAENTMQKYEGLGGLAVGSGRSPGGRLRDNPVTQCPGGRLRANRTYQQEESTRASGRVGPLTPSACSRSKA